MRFSEPPTYTVQELEQKARQFLAARFGQDVPIPVDVDLLIEHEAGVDLDYWPGLRDNHIPETGPSGRLRQCSGSQA